jgi:hypothetical protein
MARVLRMTRFCDWCKLLDIGVVEADHERMLAVDGPPKRFELCSPHDRALKEVAVLYQKFGIDPEEKPRRNVSAKKAIAAQAAQPEPEPDRGELTALAERSDAKPKIFCPKSHPKEGGRGKFVSYVDRGSHADLVHDGMKIWEIEWEDPHGVMTAACTSHKECEAVGLRFISARGLGQHKRTCPLELVD